MPQSGTYKQYSRTMRTITLDEQFNGGMRSDTVPLSDGTYKTLVNYQIMEAGDHLVPRKGKIINPDIIYLDQGKLYDNVNRKQYIDSVNHIYNSTDNTSITTLIQTFPLDSYESASKEIRSNSVGNSVVFFKTPIVKNLYAVKYNNDTIAPIDMSKLADPDDDHNDNAIVSLVGRKHPTRDMSGVSVYDSMDMFKLRPRSISTGLYNYFFAINDDGNSNKNFVRYTLTDDLLDIEDVDPRDITPSVACSTGFNMLSSTPYSFNHKDVGEHLEQFNLLGLLLYKDAACTKTALSFVPGETVYIKRFYAFPSGNIQYQDTGEYAEKHVAVLLRLEVNYGVGDNWQLLEQVGIESNTTLTDNYMLNSFSVVPFVIPEEDFSLRASIFDTMHCLPLLKTTSGSSRTVGNYYPENLAPYDEVVGTVTIKRYFAEEFFCMAQVTPTIKVTKDLDNDKVLIKEEPNYDLTTAQGMLSWKAMIVLWGVEGAPNVVFLSDVDHYNYFPYPNNIEDYENNILNVIVFMDALLVITQNCMYKTEFTEDGSLKTTTVATDLNMSYDDALNVITVKNMIFYKSGNYYYMLVPSHKALTFGELNVAPISTPINYFLDHFDTELKKVLLNMYSKEFDYIELEDMTIVPDLYDVYLANDEICIAHNIFLEIPDPTNKAIKRSYAFNFILKYNSVSRTWCSDLYHTPTGYVQLVFKNIAGVPNYAAFDRDVFGNTIYFKLLSEDSDNCQDSFDAAATLSTKHFIDTGFRALEVANKKRMREIQFKINNKLGVPLNFTSGFILDNERRVNIGSYILKQNDDELERIPTCKLISINYKTQYDRWLDPSFINVRQQYLIVRDETNSYFRIEDDTLSLSTPYDSELTFDIEDDTLVIANYANTLFTLDDCHLSLFDVATVRWKVSGKGYLPRVLLLSSNIKSYEIFGLGWIARTMNAR